jgi:type VI secretion system protein ImpF
MDTALTGETPLVPSLLDRLLDDDPGTSREPPARQAAVVAGIRAGLCRDLRDLLNAHRFLSAAVERYPEVASSLANYGLPDLQSLEIREDHDLQTLCRSIAETIRRFEPRLVDVRVAPRREEGGQRPLDRRVRFDIEAVLVVEPLREPVLLTSALDVNSGEFEVESRR